MNLLGALDGYRITCMIISMLELGLPEKIGTGETSIKELSEGLHQASLLRFLNALAVLKLVKINGSMVSLTEAGLSILNNDYYQSITRITASQYLPAWSQLSHTIRNGEPGLTKALGEFAWDHRSTNKAAGEEFIDFMQHIQKNIAVPMVAQYDFSQFKRIADIGGGKGFLILEILKKNPQIEGLVQDLPHVVEHTKSLFEENKLLARVEFIDQSFFEYIPQAELYILQYILHDWNDEKCLALLKKIKSSAKAGAKLLIMENMKIDPIKDIHMLLVSDGKERSEEELSTLLEKAGMSALRKVGNSLLEVTL